MLTTLSSNVVLAKARTMYGRRLTPADYNELLKCRTVGEVAGYLKNHTVYAKALAGIVESEVHRGQLESRLKQKQMDEYASLCKYEVEVDKHFSKSFIQRDEIEYLLRAVVFLNSGRAETSSYFFPPYLLHRSELNLQALARVKNADDFKQVVRHTSYEKLLAPFLTDSGPEKRIDYIAVENVLYSYLYSNVLKTVRKYFFGETKKQLLGIYNALMDLGNYVHIVRMKITYGTDAETAKKTLFPAGSLGREELEKMLQGKTEEEIQQVLRHTETGRRALNMKHVYLDEIPHRMNYRLCRHYIDFSIHPAVVLISYFFLSETEMNNIITIIEGKRYQLAPQEIRKLLIVENSVFSGGSANSN